MSRAAAAGPSWHGAGSPHGARRSPAETERDVTGPDRVGAGLTRGRAEWTARQYIIPASSGGLQFMHSRGALVFFYLQRIFAVTAAVTFVPFVTS